MTKERLLPMEDLHKSLRDRQNPAEVLDNISSLEYHDGWREVQAILTDQYFETVDRMVMKAPSETEESLHQLAVKAKVLKYVIQLPLAARELLSKDLS